MTEIRVDVDLPHPPARVWQVLTDPPVINRWLTNTGFVALEGGRFTVRPRGLAGIDHDLEGEVVSVEAPHKLVIKLEAPRLHTVMTVTLDPSENGCRLTVVQRGFLGPHGTMRRRVLQRTYAEIIDQRIGAELTRLALDEPAEPEQPARREGRRNAAGPFLRIPRQPPAGRPEPPRSASAPGLASHVRAPAGAPGVTRMPGFGAAMLGAQAMAAQRPVGVVPADEVARLSEAPAPPSVRPSTEPRHRAPGAPQKHDPWVRARGALGAARTWVAGIPGWSPERRSQTVAALAALLLLIALVGLLLAKSTTPRPAGPPQVGGGPREPGQASVPGQQRGGPTVRGTGAVGGPAQATGSPAPPTSPGGSAGPAVAVSPLTAAYKLESTRVSGYTASVTISNPSASAVDGWTVNLELALLGLFVYDVEGAVHAQTGKNVTFTPAETTMRVPAGGSVTLTFKVEGLGDPTVCTVDGTPCAGVS